jgi:hypothetical protein
MKSIWALVGVMVFYAGCVPSSVETTPLNAAPRPLVARPARSVEIYASSPPTRPHVDVALLRADQSNHEADTQRLVQALAERAGELGCDALFISGAGQRPSSSPDLTILDPGSRLLFGTCIAYLPQSPTVEPASPSAPPRAANAIVLIPPEEQNPPRPPGTTVDRSRAPDLKR